MTKEQLDIIVAFLTAQQFAITHLSITLANLTGTDKNELAESFRKSAELINHNIGNIDIVNMILNQIASGIDADASSLHDTQSIEEKIKKLLH